MIGINIGLRQGERKDTARNIEATGDFTVNIGDETMIEQIHRSATFAYREVKPKEIGLADLGSITAIFPMPQQWRCRWVSPPTGSDLRIACRARGYRDCLSVT